ncbi:hypothetical protein [Laceyella putida]|uniref:EfeO-type cupredoxin-like domain-containing protein n=1 Tax=Laceyella putida TaxID=110101 RepID=A0ABW2RKN5_9BACL
MKRSPLPFFCCVLAMIFLCSFSAVAEAKTVYPLQLKAGTPSVWTQWRTLPAGDLKVSIDNKGPGPIHFYVLTHCGHLECPTLVSGEVKAGEHLRIEIPHPSGKYMFKLDNDEKLSSFADAVFSQESPKMAP